jgi:hypothetical protein
VATELEEALPGTVIQRFLNTMRLDMCAPHGWLPVVVDAGTGTPGGLPAPGRSRGRRWLLSRSNEKVTLRLGIGKETRRLIRDLPSPSVMAVISHSPRVHALARETVGTIRGDDVGYIESRPGDTGSLRQAFRVAHLILFDAACWKLMPPDVRRYTEPLRVVARR